jgi:hypothetical protein
VLKSADCAVPLTVRTRRCSQSVTSAVSVHYHPLTVPQNAQHADLLAEVVGVERPVPEVLLSANSVPLLTTTPRPWSTQKPYTSSWTRPRPSGPISSAPVCPAGPYRNSLSGGMSGCPLCISLRERKRSAVLGSEPVWSGGGSPAA